MTSMIECLMSSKEVLPGARTPPTEPLKSVSPVNSSLSSTRRLSIPAVWPGVCSALIFSPPISISSPGLRSPVVPGTRSSGCARTVASG